MKFFIKLHKFKGERLRGFRQYTKVTYELYAFKFLEIGIRHLRSVPRDAYSPRPSKIYCKNHKKAVPLQRKMNEKRKREKRKMS